MIIIPINGLAWSSMGTNCAFSISKNSTTALIYAVRHKGHLGINISKTVERKDIDPLAPEFFEGAAIFVLQQAVFAVFMK